MNYKIAIDPSHGGTDSGNIGNNIIEKDFTLLISNYIKERLDNLQIENIITRNTDRTLSDDERANIINTTYGNDKNVIVLSNALNKEGEGLEIIYALKNNDTLSSNIAKEVETTGGIVNKYYQLRDPNNTSKDYYPIIRDTPNYQTIVISYGNVNNTKDAERLKNDYQDYAEGVIKAITSYIGVKYIPPEGTNYYIVKKGDSLWKIANSYGTSVEELKEENNLKNNILNIGQILLIPKKEQQTKYTVKKGDTLYKIAKENNTTIETIKKLNNLKSDTLSIGQILIIKTKTAQKTYTVKKGDSLWKIANENNTTVETLKKINNLETNLLQIGQVLNIP